MEIVRAEALVTRSSADDGVAATWLAGPGQGETLDVAIVHFTAGAATPPHVHHGGQTLVAVAGTGYVEAGGERAILHPGDVVVTPPGEAHVHGAIAEAEFLHLSVTTGRNEMLDRAAGYPGRETESEGTDA
jgi:quercetin dioxygenase-like cupin family protein